MTADTPPCRINFERREHEAELLEFERRSAFALDIEKTLLTCHPHGAIAANIWVIWASDLDAVRPFLWSDSELLQPREVDVPLLKATHFPEIEGECDIVLSLLRRPLVDGTEVCFRVVS